MTGYLLHTADCSQVLRAIEASHASLLDPAGEGEVWTEVPTPPWAYTVALVDGVVTVSLLPVPIETARAARWTEALAYRNARQDGGCATPLGRVQTDADSQRKVNGAVTAALIAQVTGAPFTPIDWTMADNSVVAHDAPALIAMGMAVVAYLDACQQAGTAIRALIDAAEDQPALDAIDITAGYPT